MWVYNTGSNVVDAVTHLSSLTLTTPLANSQTSAASANGASTIIARDASGNFTANTATLTTVTGAGSGLTSLNASALTTGTINTLRVTGAYTGITQVGTLTARVWNASTIAVANGGTGATSAANAQTNLNVPSRTGAGASGTWGINISGNAATATSATTATTAGNGGVTSVNGFTGGVQSVITRQTAVSATGTEITFTGIPSWAKRVTIMGYEVSLTGNNEIILQMGSSGGFLTSGYVGNTNAFNTTPSASGFTNGFILAENTDATNAIYIHATIFNISGTAWVYSSNQANSSTIVGFGCGGANLSATLTQLKILLSGPNTFDAGIFNIAFE
jgi:hypothetical protein